jgi:hypothetical protein
MRCEAVAYSIASVIGRCQNAAVLEPCCVHKHVKPHQQQKEEYKQSQATAATERGHTIYQRGLCGKLLSHSKS